MPTLTRDSRFFGLDLRLLARDLDVAWQRMRRWPLLAWLTPEFPVRLQQADGGESRWLASETLQPAPRGESRTVRFSAVQLPEELVLRRSLVVPASLSDAQAADAIALDVASASPFSEGDTVWGHAVLRTGGGQCRIDAALASRRQLQQVLKHPISPTSSHADERPEVWAWSGRGSPIVIAGFGEGRRLRQTEQGRRLRLGLLAAAGLLAVAIAVSPTAQLQLRALQARDAFGALEQRVAPLLAKREALVHAADRLSALRSILGERVNPLRVLDVVTQVLPDDTWLQGMHIEGRKVAISGQTGNAAALMQTIGNRPGLRDVKAPTPAYRQPGMERESFNIEFTLDPRAFDGPAPASGAAAASDAGRALLATSAARP